MKIILFKLKTDFYFRQSLTESETICSPDDQPSSVLLLYQERQKDGIFSDEFIKNYYTPFI